MVPYPVEGSKDIKHALPILAYAHDMYEKHGSQGTDSGLDQKVCVLLEKVYNKITSYMEFSEFLGLKAKLWDFLNIFGKLNWIDDIYWKAVFQSIYNWIQVKSLRCLFPPAVRIT